MKEKLKVAFGIILLPLFAAMYYVDKIILLFLPHLPQESVQKWFGSQKEMVSSTIRVVAFWGAIGIYYVITWIIAVL
jgi:hypothetical protein